MAYDINSMQRKDMLELIWLTSIKLKGKLLMLSDNYEAYHSNYSSQALALFNEYSPFSDAVDAVFYTSVKESEFAKLDDIGLRQISELCIKVSDKYNLGIKLENEQTEEETNEEWKVFLDKNKKVTKVEYGKDKGKVRIYYSNGKMSALIKMEGKEYDDKGFARKLLTAAGIEATEKANLEMQDRMLDDNLFYINKEEGWIEKEKYFERMTPKDFLEIQDYKDVTVKAVYEDSKGELTFTYTAGGKTNMLFVIKASNNQKEREWPTISGENITDNPSDIMYTTPPYGEKEVPYIPGPFPKGSWEITEFEKNGEQEFGPYKIRTNAWRWVEVWELVKNKKKGGYEWRKKKDSDGNIVKAKDSGLLIHGGGWSESNLDNKKGSNKYTDTTLGCIRISNLDVELIEKVLRSYLNSKKIKLEVK